jgi:hypothetical protein
MAQASASAASAAGTPKIEQAAHHVRDLFLRRLAVTDDRLLHLQRGVLDDGQLGQYRGANRGAARLPKSSVDCGLTLTNTFSTATSDGRCSEITAARSVRITRDAPEARRLRCG